MGEEIAFPVEVIGVSVSEILERVQNGVSTSQCRELEFGYQYIGDNEVALLCTVLHHFTALERLGLSGNGITNSGVSALCSILSLCGNLVRLHLGGNSIDDDGATCIAKTLQQTKLEELWLNDNSIDREGIRSLLCSVANSETLKRLDIDRNIGVSAALEDIVEVIPHCKTLEELHLGYDLDDLSEDFRQRIRSVMHQCTPQLLVGFEDDGGMVISDFEFETSVQMWVK